ncbi:hypothetical protein TD95_004307 [Thielaviopsis punctulata]|uniref:Major facilitator superfamily (MFS) profile domain-containing protein n=1 Tax=Thielaviopsis punctulata TaxID=72032 RepID=A0A0F4ZA80_9PEZI|nr:hypothetical protein TD95_004307 [Thielaviopsis punctulata]
MADTIAVTASLPVQGKPHVHHGLSLWPPPSSDPADPLRWPRYCKILALLSTAMFNFTANFAGSGLSVATVVLEMQFHKTAGQVNNLLTFNFLLLGVGNMVWVPLSVKFGKRPVVLLSMLALFAILVWTAKAKTFEELLAARCLSGFFSAAGESIVPGVISDIFFMHERGIIMSIYVMFAVCGTAIGPLIGGFIVSYDSNTWRTFSWVCAALAGFNFVAMFFLFPESSYTRPVHGHHDSSIGAGKEAQNWGSDKDGKGNSSEAGVYEKEVGENTEFGVAATDKDFAVPMEYKKVWRQTVRVNPLVSLPRVFAMPFLFVANIPVIWTVFVYGTNMAAQIIIIFALPSFLTPPPYSWPASSIGLMQIAAIIGFSLACYGGGYMCDIITARVIKRHGGRFVPEQRLISLLVGSWVAPAGCILVAFACAHKLSWVAVAFGFGMISFGTIFSPNIAMTYLLDSYLAFSQELLVTVNVFKNMVAFLFLYVAVDWVKSQGWIQVYMIMFMLVTLATLTAVPLYWWGGRAREAYGRILQRMAGV